MTEDERPSAEGPGAPTLLRGPAPLTRREKLWAAAFAFLPIPLTALVLVPIAVWTGSSGGEVAGAAIVYGGLLGLAAGFVAVDRFHARQCPRCRHRNDRHADECGECGYDLENRPRYACEQRHGIYLEPGLCDCGRRLSRLEVARGVGREVLFVLKVGGWLLLFLVAMGILLRTLGS